MTKRQIAIAACRKWGIKIDDIAEAFGVHPQTIKNELAEMRRSHSANAKRRVDRADAERDSADNLAAYVRSASRKAS